MNNYIYCSYCHNEFDDGGNWDGYCPVCGKQWHKYKNTEPQLRQVLLNDFQHGARKRTITMKSWKKAEQKYKKDQL